MIVILVFASLCSMFIVLESRYGDEWIFPIVGTCVSWVVMIFFLCAVPFMRAASDAEMEAFRHHKSYYEKYINSNSYQRQVAITLMVNQNDWLIKEQSYNKDLLWDIYIPDEIENLEPID